MRLRRFCGFALLAGLFTLPLAAGAEVPVYATLAVYDATLQVTAADLIEDEGLLDLIADRALTRGDVRATIQHLVYWRKIRARAYDMYSKPTYRAEARADRARLERIANLVLEREIDPRLPEISDASTTAYFIEHAMDFVRPARYRFQHLFRQSGSAPLEAETKIREAYALLLQNRPFERVARAYGQGFENPGEIAEESVRILSQSAPRLVRQLEELEPAGLSAPFQTEMGWGIVKLIEKIPERPMTLEEARARIVAALRAPERDRLMAELVGQLEAKYRVRRHYDRVSDDMRIGYNVTLFSVDDKDYDWREVQRPYLFAGRDVSLALSQKPTALPLIEEQLIWRLLERHAREQGYLSDPSIEAVYRNTIDRTMVDSCAELEKTRRMQSDYSPSEEELRQYYIAHRREKYWKPPQLTLQLIHIPWLVNPRGDESENERRREEAREKMIQVQARLARGEDFARLVQEFSQHPSRFQQGLIASPNSMFMFERVQVEQWLDRPYEDYPAFEWNQGMAKVRVVDATRGEPFTFEEVRNQILRLDLYEETEDRVRLAIRDEIIRESDIRFEDVAIARFVREMNQKHRSRAD